MNILLVDDDAGCLDGLATALEPSGHRCDAYTIPEEALKAYHQRPYDVVITDMKMPGLNGIEVLKKVRDVNPLGRVIIVTGYGDVETAIAAVNNGAYAFFGKPIQLNDLMETLEKIENEIDRQQKTKTEQAQLLKDYSKLKQIYEDIQKIIRDRLDN